MDTARKHSRIETIAVFLVCILAMFVAYRIMLTDRFSTDAFSDYYMEKSLGNAQWKLELGRPGGAAVQALLYHLGICTVTTQQPFTLALLIVMAWCCADLWSMVIKSFDKPGYSLKALVLLAILPAFINVSFGEFFFFSNCAVHWIGMLIPCQLALRCFLAGDRLGHRLGAAVLLIISLSFYQAALSYFVIWGFLITAMRCDFRTDKKAMSSLLHVLIVGAAASIVILASQKLMEVFHYTAGTKRSPSLSALFYNFFYLLSVAQYKVLLSGMHFMGITMGFIIVGLTADMIAKRFAFDGNSTPKQLIVAPILLAYAISFAPHLLSGTIRVTPRTLFGIFSYLSFCALTILYLYSKGQKHRGFILSGRTLTLILLVFLLMSASSIDLIGREQIRSNQADREQAEVILDRVAKYEQATGQSVSKLGLVFDQSTCHYQPEAPNGYMDINARPGARDWEIPSYLSYYRGSEFTVVDVPDEVRAAHFDGCEWDSFDPDEQVVLIGDTLYLGIY